MWNKQGGHFMREKFFGRKINWKALHITLAEDKDTNV
jgi:hypothetical protein